NLMYLRNVMAVADRNDDGRLTEQELKAWMDLVNDGMGTQVMLSLHDNGRGLFEILDANGDGSLSLRELRGAWTRLAAYDRDGDGAIARNEIPRHSQLTLSQGNP